MRIGKNNWSGLVGGMAPDDSSFRPEHGCGDAAAAPTTRSLVDVSDGSGPGGRAPYYSIAMDNSGGSTQILFGIDFDAAQQRGRGPQQQRREATDALPFPPRPRSASGRS